jgi:hypothetical protein
VVVLVLDAAGALGVCDELAGAGGSKAVRTLAMSAWICAIRETVSV